MKNSTRSPTNKSPTHRLKFNEKMDESSDFSDINKVLKTYRFHRQFLNLEMVNQICINSLANLNTEDLFIVYIYLKR